ncbi:transporter [Sporolactobacillus sp. THM7-7]|nr:transporter [Sporolactobacillus sp. THM7-7]
MHEAINQVINGALFKKKMIEESVFHYLVRAAMAGIFVGFAIVLCFRVGESFHAADSPWTLPMSGIFFGLALILIIYGGAELFTGNTMFFTVSTLSGATTVKDLLKNWGLCYLGNLLGAAFFAFLFAQTGIFSGLPADHLLFAVVGHKMDAPIAALFVRGILCNWLVCLAIWIPMQMKSDGAKVIAIILIVFTFFASGFEHSIANLSLFGLALAAPHPDTIALSGAVYNLIPVTLGNIVGGGFFVGTLYYYLAKMAGKTGQESDARVRKTTEIPETAAAKKLTAR